jgi:hypothetical protein
MRLILSSSARMAFGVALLATVMLASTASAFSLRSPQVAFQNAALQGIFNAGRDPGVLTAIAQLDAQAFTVSSTGIADFTLVIKLGSNAGLNSIGIYNANEVAPTLFQIFPPSALADYSVHCKFFASPGPNAGKLLVTLFNASGFVVGTTSFTGVNRDAFGFYLRTGPPGLTQYSQDFRNGGLPQVLSYQGTGINANDMWECFDDLPYAPALSLFDAVVMQVQSIVPNQGVVPTSSKSWGEIKANYR